MIDAAVAIIAEQGIQNLSLSEIEKKAGMSRGQLTYYFPSKEDILVAAFDRLIAMLKDRADAGADGSCSFKEMPHGWDRVVAFLTWFVLNPPAVPEFHAFSTRFFHRSATVRIFETAWPISTRNGGGGWRRTLPPTTGMATAKKRVPRGRWPRWFRPSCTDSPCSVRPIQTPTTRRRCWNFAWNF